MQRASHPQRVRNLAQSSVEAGRDQSAQLASRAAVAMAQGLSSQMDIHIAFSIRALFWCDQKSIAMSVGRFIIRRVCLESSEGCTSGEDRHG
jgi:hypothetical protein